MLLLVAVFALLTVGFAVPCVIDIAMTPSHHFDVPSKRLWLTVAVAFWAFGAAAWLLIGRRDVRMRAACDDLTSSWQAGPQPSLWSVPGKGGRSGRARNWPSSQRYSHGPASQPGLPPGFAPFIAPDDNPAFLLELARRIRGDLDQA